MLLPLPDHRLLMYQAALNGATPLLAFSVEKWLYHLLSMP